MPVGSAVSATVGFASDFFFGAARRGLLLALAALRLGLAALATFLRPVLRPTFFVALPVVLFLAIDASRSWCGLWITYPIAGRNVRPPRRSQCSASRIRGAVSLAAGVRPS